MGRAGIALRRPETFPFLDTVVWVTVVYDWVPGWGGWYDVGLLVAWYWVLVTTTVCCGWFIGGKGGGWGGDRTGGFAEWICVVCWVNEDWGSR